MVTHDTLKRGFNNGIKTLIDLCKTMVPIYVGVQILSVSGILNIIAKFFAPFMAIFGLPGEASLTLIVGYFASIFGALGTMAAIKLNAVQATTIAIMVSTAHNLLGEAAVVKKLGVSVLASTSVRIFFSLLFGFLYFRIFGWCMDIILDISINLLKFIWGLAKVIIPLMIIMEIFKDLKIIDKMSKFFKPVTKFFSMSENSAISLLIGMVFGLLFGAGAIISSAKEYNLDKRSIFLICMFLSLCHAVIEDTLVFAAIGANLFAIITARLIAAILATYIFSKILKPNSLNAFEYSKINDSIHHNHYSETDSLK